MSESIFGQTKNKKRYLQNKELKKTFNKRSSVENTNNVLKQLGLENLFVKGWHAVKTNAHPILLLRISDSNCTIST